MNRAAAHVPRPVRSDQIAPHPRLRSLVRRHAAGLVAPTMAPHTQAAVAAVVDALTTHPRPLILDSGCGTAEAAARLARERPQALVVGIDKSAARLARAPVPNPDHAQPLLLRADLGGFWRGLLAAGVRVAEHYLLYPNPWPKQRHLARRWHGHAVLPALLALGGRFELRTNWRIYADEFALALDTLCGIAVTPESFTATTALTAFERKYACAGQPLYRLTATLRPGEPVFA